MASLPNLIRALRERIACTSDGGGGRGDGDDPLRTIIPNLLHTYVLPSFTDKEREITAVLKLLTHTAKNFPDVFFQGRPAAVLPIVGRVFSFFSEPAFCSRHGVMFEAMVSLLSLLRGTDHEAYRLFFLDATEVIDDVLGVAPSDADEPKYDVSVRVQLKCFQESFAGISDEPALLGELPACLRPPDGPGLLVDITGKARWQSLATWTVKLLNKFLTEGTRYVSGLVSPSFLYSTCSLLCYGDENLHMACFDFSRIAALTVGLDIVPGENLIRSITCILGQKKDAASFRTATYDSIMGACFHVLHSTCGDDVVKSTASDVIDVFPKAIDDTESTELKAALCSAYVRIAKTCPIHVWRPAMLIKLLSSSMPYPSLTACIKVTIDILGSDIIGEGASRSVPSVDCEPARVTSALKKASGDMHVLKPKRQKMENEVFSSCVSHGVDGNIFFLPETKIESATDMQNLLLSFITFLRPIDISPALVQPEIAIAALSILSVVFANYPPTSLSNIIHHEFLSWIPWVYNQIKGEASIKFDILLYLEALHSILFQATCPGEMKMMKDDKKGDTRSMDMSKSEISDVIRLVKLAWSQPSLLGHAHSILRIKCLTIQILSKIVMNGLSESCLDILDLALNDEAEEVQLEAIISLPVIVFYSGGGLLEPCYKRLLRMDLQGSHKGSQAE